MNKFMTTSQASGQSIADRVIAAKHSIAGSGLAKSVCKATTEEVLGPKKKHLDYLLACTNEPNVSIPQLANLLIERTQHPNWVVVYKALVTIHNLMNYGNERFTQYLASNNCTFQLATFLDKTGVQGYDMSTYIRRYAKYLNEKSLSYRNMAFDFCKVKRGKDDGLLRTMTTEKLLKTLPGLQQQLDALLEFDVTPNELTNGVINACFMLLFKDLIRLFACYNDGIINLLEKYFEMPKKQCRDALDIYKRFLVRMDRVSEFLKVAESVGIDKGDIPDLAKAPSSLLEALEEHLKSLESSKKGRDKPASVAVAVNSFAAASQSAANVSQNANMSSAAGSVISEEEKRKIIEEEQKELEKMKEMASKEKGAGSPGAPPHSAASTNPFLASSSPAHVTPAPDLFGAATDPQPRPSNDLLALSGPSPFGDNMIPAQAPQQQQQHQQPLQNNPFGGGAPQAAAWGSPATTMGPPTTAPSHNAASWTSQQFASDAEFARAFGTVPTANGHTGFDGFGEILKPQSSGMPQQHHQQQQPMTMMGNGSAPGQRPQQPQQRVITGDLDSSLASLAGNLSMNPGASVKKTDYQWTAGPDKKALTGGNTWQQPPIAPATNYNSAPQPQMPGGGMMPPSGGFPQQGMPQMGMNPGMGGMAPMGQQGQPAMWGGQQPMAQQQAPFGASRPPQQQHNDPFGSL